MVLHNKKTIGSESEEKAFQFLKTKGMKLLTRNFHSYGGEIDLIMKDKEDLVFVEVRTRNNTRYGTALETVNYSKQQKIIKTATFYLQKNGLFNKINCRFDVIAIKGLKIDWIKNAFTADT